MSTKYPLQDDRSASDTRMVEHEVTASGEGIQDEAEAEIGTAASGSGTRTVAVSVSIGNDTEETQVVRLFDAPTGDDGEVLATYVVPAGATLVCHRRHKSQPGAALAREVLTTVASGSLYIGFELANELV